MPMEREVVCESTSTLPIALKSIFKYAEKVMEKDSNITFPLPVDIFGISRKSSMLREDIINLCNMNEVKTFTLVTYMMYLFICSRFERKCAVLLCRFVPHLFWKHTRISNSKLV
ncbi:hypothetical protein IC575_019577 [Cucumis melo]